MARDMPRGNAPANVIAVQIPWALPDAGPVLAESLNMEERGQ